MKHPIGELCEILNGYAFKSSKYVDEGIRIIRIANVQKGFIEDASPCYYPQETAGEIAPYMLEETDLLLSLTGNVGRVALLDSQFLPAALNQRVACLRIRDSKKVIKEYLFHLLNSNYFENQCIEASNGIAQKNLSTRWVSTYEIPLCNIEEQQRRAKALSSIQCSIENASKLQEELDELVKSRFVEMFDTRHASCDWPAYAIGEMCVKARSGPFGSALLHSEFVDKGVFVLGIDNAVDNKFSYKRMRYITEEKYEQLRRYTVEPLDVIITIMGTVGRSAVVPEDIPRAINSKHLACLTVNRELVNPYFLCEAFQSHPEIQRQLSRSKKGAIMDGLNLTIIKSLTFALPPLNLQAQFVELVQQVDKLKFSVQQQINKLQLLYDSLAQEYFGGE